MWIHEGKIGLTCAHRSYYSHLLGDFHAFYSCLRGVNGLSNSLQTAVAGVATNKVIILKFRKNFVEDILRSTFTIYYSDINTIPSLRFSHIIVDVPIYEIHRMALSVRIT